MPMWSWAGASRAAGSTPPIRLLPNHVYRADVSPGGGKVQITVHQTRRSRTRGPITYVIDFKRQGPSTVITTENRRMPPKLAAKMQYDIDRWQRGASDCNRKMPAVQSALGRSPASEANEATADALARQCAPEGAARLLADPSCHAIAVRGPIDLVGSSLTRASSRQSTNATADGSAGTGAAGRGSDAEAE